MYDDYFSHNLEEVKSLFQSWHGYSAKILSYDGSPWIGSHLSILFSSHKKEYYNILCGMCNFFETKFIWNVNNLNITVSDSSKNLHIYDRANNLSICTEKILIKQYLNVDRLSQMELSICNKSSNCVSKTEQRFNIFCNEFHSCNMKFYVRDLNPFDNEIYFSLCEEPDDKPIKWIVAINPRYWYLNHPRKERTVSDIEIQLINESTIRLFERGSQDFVAEFDDIYIISEKELSWRKSAYLSWTKNYFSIPALFELGLKDMISLKT